MKNSHISTILGLIIIGVFSRLSPHLPNVTSMTILALFTPLYFSRSTALTILFSTLILSDLVIGFHSTMLFVYVSYGLVTLFSTTFQNYLYLRNPFVKSLFASIFLCVISNLGVWLTSSLYPKSLEGLILCYTAALPFLVNRIIGDQIYLSIFIGISYSFNRLHAVAKS